MDWIVWAMAKIASGVERRERPVRSPGLELTGIGGRPEEAVVGGAGPAGAVARLGDAAVALVDQPARIRGAQAEIEGLPGGGAAEDARDRGAGADGRPDRGQAVAEVVEYQSCRRAEFHAPVVGV